jgi:pyruvate/2-oxoglutarate/acetoin dehydrogenase E1 component
MQASVPRRCDQAMAELNLVQAVNLALARALLDDPDVVLFGQDIGIHGGVFRATEGLYQRFGGKRVIDTPLDEMTIGGLAVGMATQGLKPVCEIQFIGFIYPVLDNLANHAGRMRTRTRGRLSCPLVPWRARARPRASLGQRRSPARPYARSAGRDPVIAAAGLRLAACCNPRSRSGGIPRANAALPGVPRGGGR